MSTWFTFLEPEAQALANQSRALLARERRLKSVFDDYAFVVFPMAKAYESFLKKYLYSRGLLDQEQYRQRQFRIGRALNPDIPVRQQDEYWFYDDLQSACGAKVAKEIWDTWLAARNHLFHYFPSAYTHISLETAASLLKRMEGAMTQALACQARAKISYALH